MLSIERNQILIKLEVERNPLLPFDIKRNPPGMSLYTKPEKIWGGCLPYVPCDCEKIDYCFIDEGIRWIDLSICHGCSIQSKCQIRLDYLKALNNEIKVNLEKKANQKKEEENDE